LAHIKSSPWIARSGVLLAAAALVFLASLASAQDFVVDQAADNFAPGVYYGIWSHTPLGQEFTPSLDHVDVVELRIHATTCTLFQVLIREDTIQGEILGSATKILDWPNAPVERFEFDEPVPLVPGQRYVIEVRDLSGADGSLGIRWTKPYSGGRLICHGVPWNSWDAWFREGVWVFPPVLTAANPWFRDGVGAFTPVEATTWGAIKSMFR
jgi:hypothetical protein